MNIENKYSISYDWEHRIINGCINGVVRVSIDNCDYNRTSIMIVMSMLLIVEE